MILFAAFIQTSLFKLPKHVFCLHVGSSLQRSRASDWTWNKTVQKRNNPWKQKPKKIQKVTMTMPLYYPILSIIHFDQTRLVAYFWVRRFETFSKTETRTLVNGQNKCWQIHLRQHGWANRQQQYQIQGRFDAWRSPWKTWIWTWSCAELWLSHANSKQPISCRFPLL